MRRAVGFLLAGWLVWLILHPGSAASAPPDPTPAAPEVDVRSVVFPGAEPTPGSHVPQTALDTNPAVLLKTADLATALYDETLTYEIRLTNITNDTHTYSLTDPLPDMAAYVAGSATGGLAYDANTQTLTAETELPSSALTIQPGPETIPQQSIKDTGTDICQAAVNAGAADCNGVLVNLDVPGFSWDGNSYDQIGMTSYGYALVGGGTLADLTPANVSLPNPAVPNNILAPWWGPLVLDEGSSLWAQVLHYFPVSTLVLEWNQVWLNGVSYTFQIWIFEGTDQIWFTYLTNTPIPTSATIGAEDQFGVLGATYAAAVSSGTDLRVRIDAGRAVYSYQVQPQARGATITNTATVQEDTGSTFESTAVTQILNNPRLQVVHLAPFAAGDAEATLTRDGFTYVPDLSYGEATDYLPLEAGSYQFGLIPSGVITPVLTTTLTLSDNLDYTAVAAGGTAGQPADLFLLENQFPAPPAGSQQVRTGNLAAFTSINGALVFRYQDGTPFLGGNPLPYGSFSPFQPLTAGDVDLLITRPNGFPLIDPASTPLNAGGALSLLAAGDGWNQLRGLYALPPGAPGEFLPLNPLTTVFLTGIQKSASQLR